MGLFLLPRPTVPVAPARGGGGVAEGPGGPPPTMLALEADLSIGGWVAGGRFGSPRLDLCRKAEGGGAVRPFEALSGLLETSSLIGGGGVERLDGGPAVVEYVALMLMALGAREGGWAALGPPTEGDAVCARGGGGVAAAVGAEDPAWNYTQGYLAQAW